MKLGRFFKSAVLMMALAGPMFTSCYNDAALWNEIDGIHGDVADLKQKLAELESKLNTDLKALQALLEAQIKKAQGDLEDQLGDLEDKVNGLVTVKNVVENTDGSVTVTLSDNTEFTVHPKFEQDYKGLVTTVELDGVLYWAVYDETGKAVAVTDADENLVPVVDVVPQVRVDEETALVEISFDGGLEWIEVGYNEPCVFEGAEVLYDEYGYATVGLELTLADGSVITVLVDGEGGIMFGDHMSGAFTTRFVPCGESAEIIAMLDGVASWIKEVPAGWKVEEITDNVEYGELMFNVTAPTAAAIESGAAVPEGQLKLLAVLEGGKSITESVTLTTKAFGTMAVDKGAVTIEKYSGVSNYFFGIVPVDDFDAAAVKAEVEAIIAEDPEYWYYNDYPNLAYYSIEGDLTVNEILEDAEYGKSYVLYALGLIEVPAESVYDPSQWTILDAVSSEFVYMNIELDEDATVATFSSIDISMKFQGVGTFYGGFEQFDAEEGVDLDYIVQTLNREIEWGMAEAVFAEDVCEDGIFTGDPAALVNSYEECQPGANYCLWVVPTGKTSYTTSDLYVYEFATEDLISGGSIAVVPGDAQPTYTSILVPLTAENAWGIYYAWVEPEMISTIADKAEYLMTKGIRSVGESVSARTNSNYSLTLKAGSSAVLLAIAIDENGAYGDVFEQTFSTKEVSYNDVTFELSLDGDVTDKANVKVTVSGGEPTEYYYMYCKKDEYKWTDTFGGSEEAASEFFATAAYTYYFTTVKTLPEGGIIELEDLEYGDYVFVISSSTKVDGEKVYSKAKVLEFKRDLNLGTIVSAKDDNGNDNADWVAAKPTVNYVVESVGDDTSVLWTISDLPEGWTGFTAVIDSEYTAAYASDRDLITFLLIDEYGFATKYDIENGANYTKHWLYTANYDLYVVIVDPQGNYYAPYKWNFDATAGGFGV